MGYLGTVGMAHAIGSVLDAAERLRDAPEIVMLIAGAGAEWDAVDALRRDRGLENVVLLRARPREEMPALWALVDIALVHLKDTPLFATVIPSKLFEAMAMGRPVLVAAPEGEASGIVCRTGAGRAIESGAPDRLAATY